MTRLYCALNYTYDGYAHRAPDAARPLWQWCAAAAVAADTLRYFQQMLTLAQAHPFEGCDGLNWLRFYTQSHGPLTRSQLQAVLQLPGWGRDQLNDLAWLPLETHDTRPLVQVDIILGPRGDLTVAARIYARLLNYTHSGYGGLFDALTDRSSLLALLLLLTLAAWQPSPYEQVCAFLTEGYAEFERCSENADSPRFRAAVVSVGRTWSGTLTELVNVCIGILADSSSSALTALPATAAALETSTAGAFR